jgi:hypothetical protein
MAQAVVPPIRRSHAEVEAAVTRGRFSRAELYAICCNKEHKPEARYFIDGYIRFCDQHVLRTPPYHPEYQPQEPQLHAIKKYVYDGYDGNFATVQQRILDSRLDPSVVNNMHAFSMHCFATAVGHYHRDIKFDDSNLKQYISSDEGGDMSSHPSDCSDGGGD